MFTISLHVETILILKNHYIIKKSHKNTLKFNLKKLAKCYVNMGLYKL